MKTKSQQLQVRVTPAQKSAIKRMAAGAGLDVSSYVLARVLPATRQRVEEHLDRLSDDSERRFALAELNDLLAALSGSELRDSLEGVDVTRLSSLDQNYVAAMVEQAAYMRGVTPPAWTARVRPLDTPYFTTPLASLRPHLLRASPVPFKRRNIFIDSSLGARV